jgi:hypothetical protein
MSAVFAIQRAAILTALQAVPGIGKVHDRERYSRDEARFRQHYLYTPPPGAAVDSMIAPHLRGWWFRRAETREWQANTRRTVNQHTWLLRGLLALDDEAASELVFDFLIERLRDAVRADLTFGGVFAPGPMGGDGSDTGLQVLESGPVTFAGVLCHSAQLQLTTWTHI